MSKKILSIKDPWLHAYIEKQLEARATLEGSTVERTFTVSKKDKRLNSKEKFLENADKITRREIKVAFLISKILTTRTLISPSQISILIHETKGLSCDNVMKSYLPSPPFRKNIQLKELYLSYKLRNNVMKSLDDFIYRWSKK